MVLNRDGNPTMYEISEKNSNKIAIARNLISEIRIDNEIKQATEIAKKLRDTHAILNDILFSIVLKLEKKNVRRK